MKHGLNLRNGCTLALCTLALLSGACADDDDGTSGGMMDGGLIDAATPPAQPPGDGATPPPAPSSERFSLVTQLVPSADQATSYLALTDTLASAQPVKLDGAPQVLGRALAAGIPGSGVMFVGSGASPEIARYELQADGSLKRAASVSLQTKGVAGIGEYAAQLQIISNEKAYYFDSRTAQVVVWNPSTMTVGNAIDLRALTMPDALLTFTSTQPVRRGTQLVMPVGWRSSNNQRVIQKAGVVVIDTSTDTARVLTDDRCGYVRDAAEAADGRIYLATEAFATAVHRVNAANAPAPCLLRLQADLSAYDATFHKELNALSGAPAGSLVRTLSGRTFIRVLDEATANVSAMTVPRALASMPAWGWAEITLSDSPVVTRVAGAPLGTGSLIVFDTKDRRLLAEVANDGTKIRDLSNGVGEITITTSGLTFSGVQLR